MVQRPKRKFRCNINDQRGKIKANLLSRMVGFRNHVSRVDLQNVP